MVAAGMLDFADEQDDRENLADTWRAAMEIMQELGYGVTQARALILEVLAEAARGSRIWPFRPVFRWPDIPRDFQHEMGQALADNPRKALEIACRLMGPDAFEHVPVFLEVCFAQLSETDRIELREDDPDCYRNVLAWMEDEFVETSSDASS
jgi:hypothetical protein